MRKELVMSNTPDTRKSKSRQYIDDYSPEDELNFVEAEEYSPYFEQEDCSTYSSLLFEDGEDAIVFL